MMRQAFKPCFIFHIIVSLSLCLLLMDLYYVTENAHFFWLEKLGCIPVSAFFLLKIPLERAGSFHFP